ncbi:MAG: hypothetical protein M3R13_04985 [Armatimonadota bacterium]|nr:hypothetical protein [Armatimonadota bacterium]
MDEDQFGYLGTDEEVVRRPKQSDFERSVLSGCVTFSLASTLQLAAVGVPMLSTRSIHTSEELFQVLAIYLAAAVLCGAIFTVFAGLAGLCGSVAGLVPAATFLWLRLKDATTGLPGIEGMEPATYPAGYAWIVPAVTAPCLALAFLGAYGLRVVLSRRAR